MRRALIGSLLALLLPSIALADAPEEVWPAMKERDVLVVKTDGSEVAGKLV